MIDHRYFEYASERQLKYLKVLDRCKMDTAKAAEKAGISQRTMQSVWRSVKLTAGLAGFDPEHDLIHPVGQGQNLSGASVYYKATPTTPAMWVKGKVTDAVRERMLLDAIISVGEEWRGMSDKRLIKEPTKSTRSDVLALYPMGDPHLGMYAWAEETNNDFDCNIAERDLRFAVDDLVYEAPESDIGIILNLGDFFHTDSSENRTNRSGHPLDVDTRWQRLLDIGINVMRYTINKALTKHKTVIVRNNIGNHDERSSVMLATALRLLYENNPRVQIDKSVNAFWYYKFGTNMLGSCHGDNTKPQDLMSIMQIDQRKNLSDVRYCSWHMGHVHHKQIWEFRDGTVESHRTLASRDAWHHKSGYRSARDMQMIMYHIKKGERGRVRSPVFDEDENK